MFWVTLLDSLWEKTNLVLYSENKSSAVFFIGQQQYVDSATQTLNKPICIIIQFQKSEYTVAANTHPCTYTLGSPNRRWAQNKQGQIQ